MKLNTQIPDALYQQIETLANKEQIPVEQLINMALSAQISAWLTKEYLEEKAQKGSWDKFKQALDKVSNQEPEDYDKL
ncbi:MAG: hypothetical protein AB4057_19955 [Crocosphaera sp.]